MAATRDNGHVDDKLLNDDDDVITVTVTMMLVMIMIFTVSHKKGTLGIIAITLSTANQFS